MALTRKALSAMDIDAEKIDEIIKMHLETVNPLKEQADKVKGLEDENKTLKSENESLKKDVEAAGKDEWKDKYSELEKEFKEYKQTVADEKSRDAKTKALTEILKDVGITDEKNIAKVLKYSDLDKLEIEDDGKLTDAKNIAKEMKTEWAELVTTQSTQGANVANPPSNNGGVSAKSKEEIMAIKDTAERQKAIADNHELFGF